jgi:hypothetical protein
MSSGEVVLMRSHELLLSEQFCCGAGGVGLCQCFQIKIAQIFGRQTDGHTFPSLCT